MKLLYRLGYYLAGFSVGLILLTFIFSGKKTSCNYGPSARVKDNMLQKTIQISPEILRRFHEINDSILRDMITQGSIDFSKSETQLDSCRQYYIEIDQKAASFLQVENCKRQLKVFNMQLH